MKNWQFLSIISNIYLAQSGYEIDINFITGMVILAVSMYYLSRNE